MATPVRWSGITGILLDLQAGKVDAAEANQRIFTATYQELRRLAAHLMRAERDGHTLRPTALVHEAFLRLVDGRQIAWTSRAHFFGIAARAMRQVLVDHARRRSARKRGARWTHVTLDEAMSAPDGDPDAGLEILSLHEALEHLSSLDGRMAHVVELKVFGGLTMEEVAGALGVSKRTAENDWTVARTWLSRELRP